LDPSPAIFRCRCSNFAVAIVSVYNMWPVIDILSGMMGSSLRILKIKGLLYRW
jgi:hypothetical protein